MRVILTGATGYVGEGVLRSCLEDERVEKILSISRRPSGLVGSKLEEYLVEDLMSLTADDPKLQGYDAVFFCAGTSSVGLTEEQFRPIAHDIPVHLACTMAGKEKMTYCYISGSGVEGKEQMWNRVKGQTEHELQQLGFYQVFNFRPAAMKPYKNMIHVKKSDKFAAFLYPVLRLIGMGNTLEEVGRAMINATLQGYGKVAIEVKDIKKLAKRSY